MHTKAGEWEEASSPQTDASSERQQPSVTAQRKRKGRAPQLGVNLRDVGGVAPDIIKQGVVFRSSELMRYRHSPM